MTELLFRDDAYLRETDATALAVGADGIVVDRTVFYAQGGGQPGDRGRIVFEGGETPIDVAVFAPDRKSVLHKPAAGAALPPVGARVRLVLDWPSRHLRMRTHTALHLLTVALPFPVTGGAIGDGEGRLDFDMPEGSVDRDETNAAMARMVGADAQIRERWITDGELLANPGLVKTMSVKPPTGTGRVRLVEIVGLDLQPCGGTHVRSTAEIGTVRVVDVEKKGRLNRRVRIALA